ncbi:MAG: hypothetical protein AAF597_17680, partial [Bacteroidota bacterium]
MKPFNQASCARKRLAQLLVVAAMTLLASAPLRAVPQEYLALIPNFAPATPPTPPNEFHPPYVAPDICETDNNVFLAGEKIVYKL